MLDNRPLIPDKQGVFARLGKILMVAALIGAIGGHWALLQSVAWANMLAENTGTGTLSEAIVKTFDGKHPCCLCKQIAQGQQAEKKTEQQTSLKKLEFTRPAIIFCLSAPVHFYLQSDSSAFASLLAETPPVPPPRSLQG